LRALRGFDICSIKRRPSASLRAERPSASAAPSNEAGNAFASAAAIVHRCRSIGIIGQP
jgi:hypothetical protein